MNEADESKDEHARTVQRIQKALDSLAEHCTSVQLIAVLPGENGAQSLYVGGRGDIYSRLGAVREWLIRQDEQAKIAERGNDDA